MNIVIAQSGGPTCAINATLAGVYLEACKHPEIEKSTAPATALRVSSMSAW